MSDIRTETAFASRNLPADSSGIASSLRHSHAEAVLAPALMILLSSFLLFLVQPILARQILPWFGGSAGVWTVCLVFFQVVLLLGYTYAHLLTRVRGTRQFVIHILLLLASCLTLPIVPGSAWRHIDSTPPELRILGLLAATVGLPYFLLSSTAPLLQRWLSSSLPTPAQRHSIYRLFALSNLGSLLGLLSYPFAIEPFAPLHIQVWVWSCAYGGFALSSVYYAWRRRNPPQLGSDQTASSAGHAAPPSAGTYAFWIGCAALGSILLVGGTNQLTQNIASIPLLWIVPLSLYLLSFTLCFEGRAGRGWYERRFWVTPAMLATGAMAWVLFAGRGAFSLYVSVPIFTVGMFLGYMVCHGELARSKPDPLHLTRFYLSIASGGALGSLLVGILAPQVFRGYWELPLGLVALASLGVYCCSGEIKHRPSTSWLTNVAVAAVAAGLVLLLLGAWLVTSSSWDRIVLGDARWGCAAVLIATPLLLQRYGLWRAVALATLLCTMSFSWHYYNNFYAYTELAVRNFYGTLRVTVPDGPRVRWLMHGTITHGAQVAAAPQRYEPTTYYGKSSGIGRAIQYEQATVPSLRIGSVGLGAGTLAAYGRPGDLIRIYELNPAVLGLARHPFTYLSDSKAHIEPVLGDGRLSLEFELAHGAFDNPEQRFDVLSLDAFSGDAIPVHLLTSEAFATYMRVTKPDGVIAFHVSNQYLDLAPIIARIAREVHYQAVLITDLPKDERLVAASEWVLVTKNSRLLQQPQIASYASPIALRPNLPLWTDEFTSLFQVLK